MVVKKKTKKPVKKKTSKRFDSFSEKSLKKYINMIKKVRKKKKGKKKKKVGLTNTISLLNLLYNVDNERKKKPRRNLMKKNPYAYPSMIRNADVDRIWRSTKMRSGGKKQAMVGNMNSVFNNLVGFDLLHSTKPAKKLPKHQRGRVNIVPAQSNIPVQESDVAVTTSRQPSIRKMPPLPSRPSRAPPIRKIPALPSKPSRAPPVRYDSDDESSSSDGDSDHPKRKKKRYV
jgi:hypothetical protein